MKRTLALGLSTAIVMVSLSSCVFDRPTETKYGCEVPEDEPTVEQNTDEPLPDVYGPAPA
jgi:hypothetical protein